MDYATTELNRAIARMGLSDVFAPSRARARHRLWEAEDGWIIGYTTARIETGEGKGKFAIMIYEPDKTGSTLTQFHVRNTRMEAKHGALMFYYEHSPNQARRDGWDGLDYRNRPQFS